MFSCTPEQGFHRFYPYEKNLSHIPVPTRGRHKNWTAASDVIVMLKWCNHVMSRLSVSRNFWKPFSKYKWWARKIIHYSCENGTEKPVPRDHRLSSLDFVMPIGDPRDRFFYPTLKLIWYCCLHVYYTIINTSSTTWTAIVSVGSNSDDILMLCHDSVTQ